MLWNLGKSRPQLSHVHQRSPLFRSFSDGDGDFSFTENTSGHFCQVYELEGFDYTGIDDDAIAIKFNGRLKFIESIGLGIVPTFYTLRFKLSKAIDFEDHGSEVSNMIAHEWASGFDSSYRNRHFLMLRTESAGALDRLVDSAQGGGDSREARLAKLKELKPMIESELVDYSPHLLTGDHLASFWATLLNGESCHLKMPKDGIYDDFLSSCGIHWPGDKPNVQIYEGNTDRLSTWVTLKIFDDGEEGSGIGPSVFKELYSLDYDYLLVQSFDQIAKEKALKEINKIRKRYESFDDESLSVKISELKNLLEEIQADKIKLVNFRFALQIFADTEAELTKAVSAVTRIVKSHGFNCLRERNMSEPLFWSMFPGYEKELQPRERKITTRNLACHVNLSSIGEGLNSCSWGDMPVTSFLTETGSEYSFCFQANADPKALGHTLIMGESGYGKTTLMMMLATMCRKYPGMRQIFFDQLRGMKIGVEIQGGDYISFDRSPQVNPLQQKDSHSNRNFLTNWLKELSGMDDDASLEVINKVINQNFQLAKQDRTLDNLADVFGLNSDDSIRAAMTKWLTGGSYGSYFTGDIDSLGFEKDMIGFDMTRLVNAPDVLGPMVAYMYHRFEEMVVEKPGPFIKWTDEYRHYIQNPFLGAYEVKAKAEWRKLDGVCVDACQNLSHVVGKKGDRNKYGLESIGQYQNFFFFPDPKADFDDLQEFCGINESEFKWIREEPSKRKVLLKRKQGTSTILDVDFKRLGNLLNAFSSDNDKVQTVNRLQREHGRGWENKYLGI